MSYFSGMFRNEAGTPGARDISSRSSIISERLRKRVEMVQVRQEKRKAHRSSSTRSSASSIPGDRDEGGQTGIGG